MKPTLSTAAASGTVGLAIVVILTWVLQLVWHVTLPTDVGTAIAVILAAFAHWIAVVHIFPAPIEDAITKETKP